MLKAHARIVLIDVCYPCDGNWLGTRLTDLWKLSSDIIRDMGEIFRRFGFEFVDEDIGGLGSVHLCVAERRT